MNETERTRIALLFGVLGIAAAAVSGVFPVILLTDPTEASIQVFQALVVLFAVAGVVPWWFVTRGVKERLEYIPPRQFSARESIRALLGNPAGRVFLAFDGITAGINFTVLTSITFVLAWLFGMNNAHLQANPSWTFASLIPAGFVVFCGLVIGIATCLVIQHRRDVRTVFSLSFLLQAIGFFMAFLGTLPVPGTPSLIYALPPGIPVIVLGVFIASIGMPADYILHAVVRSDVIDFDEHLTGERREAIYAGFGTIFSKIMTSFALAIVPAVLAWFGLVAGNPVHQEATAMVVPGGDHGLAITGVGVAAFLIPAMLATVGLFTWQKYPLGRVMLARARAALASLHEEKRRTRQPDPASGA